MKLKKPCRKTQKLNMVIMLANDECPKLGCVPGCFSNGAYCDCPTFAAPAKCVKTCGG